MKISGNIEKKTAIKYGEKFNTFAVSIKDDWYSFGSHSKEEVEEAYKELAELSNVEVEYFEREGTTGKVFKNIKKYKLTSPAKAKEVKTDYWEDRNKHITKLACLKNAVNLVENEDLTPDGKLELACSFAKKMYEFVNEWEV